MTKFPPTYIITDSDRDGLLAGYAVWRRVRQTGADAFYYALGSGSGGEKFDRHYAPEDVLTGKPGLVYVLDMTLPQAVLQALAEHHHSVIVIDHHASTANALIERFAAAETADEEEEGLLASERFAESFFRSEEPAFFYDMTGPVKIGYYCSVNHSAADLAWRFFFKEAPPRLVAAVEDWDIWRFALYGSAEICLGLDVVLQQAGLSTAPKNQDEAKRAMELLGVYVGSDPREEELYCIGGPVLSYRQAIVESVAESASMVVFLDDERQRQVVPCVVGCPRHISSLVGDALCKANPDAPFAIVISPNIADQAFRYSLYSRNGADCGKIAVSYGGGGHHGAAGFSFPYLPEHLVSAFLPPPVDPPVTHLKLVA